MLENKRKEMIKGKCQVCNLDVMIDERGNGEKCGHCGWIQDAASRDRSDIPTTIVLSLNKARQLYKEGKPFKVGFDDFINAFEFYGEMEFYYDKVCYGMCWTGKGEGVYFWVCDVPIEQRIPVEFASLEEFINKANIGGVLIKDLWDKVENPYYLQ
jgi:hypothetical protein